MDSCRTRHTNPDHPSVCRVMCIGRSNRPGHLWTQLQSVRVADGEKPQIPTRVCRGFLWFRRSGPSQNARRSPVPRGAGRTNGRSKRPWQENLTEQAGSRAWRASQSRLSGWRSRRRRGQASRRARTRRPTAATRCRGRRSPTPTPISCTRTARWFTTARGPRGRSAARLRGNTSTQSATASSSSRRRCASGRATRR